MTQFQIRLRHLTFVSQHKPPAAVEFGPSVTLVRGPSDTGKSFIVDAIDFMLGASTLKEIPEREGYHTVLLGLELPDSSVVTLSRSVDGGAFGLYRRDVSRGPLEPPDETLAAKHNPSSERNLSRFLLQAVGLDGRRVRRNVRNETDSLSFRNVAHLCVVDETQMQSDVSPALTGSYVTRTKEVSVLKLFLQDEDDSALIPVESKSEVAKLSSAKLSVVDRLLAEIEAQLSDVPEQDQLRDQARRLSFSIDQQSASIGDLVDARTRLTRRLSAEEQLAAGYEVEWGDTGALAARFDLLKQRYESDLERLATLREAGTLLGYFTAGTCAFCGAEPEHQHRNTECEGDETSFGMAVDEQIRRTHALASDLQSTIEDVQLRRQEIRSLAAKTSEARGRLQEALSSLEESLTRDNGQLREFMRQRAVVDRHLGLYDQVESLEKMKRIVVEESSADTAAVAATLSLRAQREFSAHLVERLKAWGYPEAEFVRYDALSQDVVAGDQLRAAHGKGVRAILHAAFTVALATYCAEREISHPGFVILDTPVLTYRPPDADLDEGGEAPADVVDGFYHDLQRRDFGQVIIMENTDPSQPLDKSTVDVVFTAREHGRYGFFPVGTSSRVDLPLTH